MSVDVGSPYASHPATRTSFARSRRAATPIVRSALTLNSLATNKTHTRPDRTPPVSTHLHRRPPTNTASLGRDRRDRASDGAEEEPEEQLGLQKIAEQRGQGRSEGDIVR